MKALGIVRKIDDLGRVVIPKEVRDSRGWPSGQNMELFLTDEGLMLRPYMEVEEKEQAIDTLKKIASGELDKEKIEEVIEYLVAR